MRAATANSFRRTGQQSCNRRHHDPVTTQRVFEGVVIVVICKEEGMRDETSFQPLSLFFFAGPSGVFIKINIQTHLHQTASELAIECATGVSVQLQLIPTHSTVEHWKKNAKKKKGDRIKTPKHRDGIKQRAQHLRHQSGMKQQTTRGGGMTHVKPTSLTQGGGG